MIYEPGDTSQAAIGKPSWAQTYVELWGTDNHATVDGNKFIYYGAEYVVQNGSVTPNLEDL